MDKEHDISITYTKDNNNKSLDIDIGVDVFNSDNADIHLDYDVFSKKLNTEIDTGLGSFEYQSNKNYSVKIDLPKGDTKDGE